MTAHLGWYAHHHGRGHALRAAQVGAHLATPATLLTSATPPAAWRGATLALPLDVAPGAIELPATRALHWAPGHVPGLRARTRLLTTWFDELRPSLVVVDVSVEVALLARLAGVPVAWVRQHGIRRDPAHLGAYEAASVVVSPWPAWLDDDRPDQPPGDRLVHVGGFSRLEGHELDRATARRALGWGATECRVVVLCGGGGLDLDRADLAAAATATPDWHWSVLGLPASPSTGGHAPTQVGASPPAFDDVGWVDDPLTHLVGADLVVAAGGHNAVMDVAAAGTPLVVVPQARPWDEQVHKATLLARHRLAHVWTGWPRPRDVPRALADAVADPRTPAALVDGHGAARMAALLDGLAGDLAVAA